MTATIESIINEMESIDVEKIEGAIPTAWSGAVVVIYNRLEVWDDRQAAKDFYTEATYYSEGCERDRYVDILLDLAMGCKVCYDGASQFILATEHRHAGDWL